MINEDQKLAIKDVVSNLQSRVETLEAENAIMKEALKYYADKSIWDVSERGVVIEDADTEYLEHIVQYSTHCRELSVSLCGGKRAREALEKLK